MVEWQDLHKERSGKPIYVLMKQMVEAELMPPLDALVKPSVTPLTLADKDTLLKWLAQGAPKSSQACGDR